MRGSDFDLTNVDQVLTTTRAVRKRLDLDRPVDKNVILECLRIATQAPTGSNLQRWRWVVITDDEKKKGIAELYRRAIGPYHEAMSQLLKPGDEQRARVASSSEYLEEVLERVPVLVIPCHLGTPDDLKVLLRALGYPLEVSDNVAASGFYGSIWPAVWSFMIALRSRGLGSAPTTMHLVLEREAAEILEIPETVTQIGLIPVAYFKGATFKAAARRPIEEVTYWNAWKNKDP